MRCTSPLSSEMWLGFPPTRGIRPSAIFLVKREINLKLAIWKSNFFIERKLEQICNLKIQFYHRQKVGKNLQSKNSIFKLIKTSNKFSTYTSKSHPRLHPSLIQDFIQDLNPDLIQDFQQDWSKTTQDQGKYTTTY